MTDRACRISGAEQWTLVQGRHVHGWRLHAPVPDAHVVILPGLGLPRYLGPLTRALAERRISSTLLDLPGLASGRRRDCPADVRDVGAASAAFIRALDDGLPVVVLGHSTGALAALAAALDPRGIGDGPRSLVMAGPVFVPSQRRLSRVILTAPRAYLRDSPRQLPALVEAFRAPSAVLALVRSGLAVDARVALPALRIPLLLTAGTADAFAPKWWLAELQRAAMASPRVRTSVLGGSHNNPFTHAEDLADQVRTEADALGRD